MIVEAGQVSRYEHLFGEVTPAHLWGTQFWPGMERLLQQYLGKLPQWLPDPLGNAKMCHFQVPPEFSKHAAQQPKLPGMEGKAYAAYYWDFEEGSLWVLVACQWILLQKSKPWKVHKSWIVQF